MIRLDTYQRKLQALLGGAVTTNQPTAVVCYTDKENENQKKFFVESFVATLNNATPVDICPAPDKAMVREIDSIHIRNNDTVAATVTVRVDDNGTNYEVVEVALQAGETLLYTKASGWSTITLYGQQKSVFGYIDFDVNATPAVAEGRLFWDSGDGSLTLGLKGGNTALQLGQENVALCYNDSGGVIAAGSVVAVSGAQGQRPKIVLADADTEPLSAATLGVAAESIANGAEGFVCTFGLVRGIDTSTFTAGNPVYLSQTAGKFTATRPSAPAHTVFLGWVIKVNASSGELFVNISNGWELDELHNVLISSPSNGQVLAYEQSTSLWKNASISSIGVSSFSAGTTGFTPSTATTGAVTLAGTLKTSNGGTGLTSFTANGVVYASSTSVLATGSSFVFDGTSVGIGTSGPSKKLDIEIGSALNGARVISTGSGSGACAVYEGISYRSDGNATFQTRFAGAFRRSDGTAIGSGQALGSVLFGGQWGVDTTYQSAKVLYPASIVGVAEGNFTAANAMATGIAFRTGLTGDDAYSVNLTYGSERMRIDSSGNVGINTSSPSALLDVNGNVAITGTARRILGDFTNGTRASRVMLQTSTANSATRVGVIPSGTGTVSELSIHNASDAGNASIGQFLINATEFRIANIISGTGTYVPMTFFTNNAERIRITTAGDVGIGTSSPGEKLAVVGAITISGQAAANKTSAGTLDFYATDNSTRILSWGSSGVGGKVSFWTGNGGSGTTERMTVDGSGNVGIGTASPGAKLDVNGLIRSYGSAAGLTLGNRTSGSQADRYTIYVTSDSLYLYDNTATSDRAVLNSNGEMIFGGTTDQGAYNLQCNGTGVWGAGAYVNGSDARIKENIQPLDSGMDVIQKINPVVFNYKEDWSSDRSLQTGFIAQDLLVALSGKEYADGIVQQNSEYMSVAYQSLIPILVKAIQELKTEFDAYKASHP